MTTKYSVKRCETFGFAQTLRNAITLFQPSDYEHANVFLLHSSTSEPPKTFQKLTFPNKHFIQNISDLKPISNSSNKNIIFVELGFKNQKTINVPIESDDTDLIVAHAEENKVPSDFSHAILSFINNSESIHEILEHKLSDEFIDYILSLYPILHGHQLKSDLLTILKANNCDTHQLISKYPYEYEEKTIDTITTAPMFSDIEISIDLNDNNTSSSLYRPDKDALKLAALGKTTQLDAFTENKFAIIHTKKHAGIETRIRNQNHDVLDTLAVNGVMKSPETAKPLSIYQLMIALEQFPTFNIVFIHPSYEVKSMQAEYPCEQIIPSYTINQGEILAIVYRYLVMRFFGYCSIFTDSMLEWRYYI